MFTIKIHLDPAEHAVIGRLADKLHVSPEDLAYAGLDHLMNHCRDEAVQRSVVEIKAWRGENLPDWADTERSVHAYEGSADDQPEQRLRF
ncbi:hypothetical protein [Actomonas aquatica]|uniref:CopG family transcriptional regulator n=1 Tax=Actomonas aquatica TaxID=2866162 RepID=A0ABZ1CAR8_9BACT|nr:hypothetical protein [Opitutus sp. WL0086]WRQ88626.1 hypothetical protein K1X11_004365 [Opitutus sp. WL0086]